MTHEFSEQRDPCFENSAQLEFFGCGGYQLISSGELVAATREGVKVVSKTSVTD